MVALPLRNKFRGVLEREILLFEGPNGWAEWSPFVEYSDEESAVWLAAAIEFGYGDIAPANRTEIAVNATLPALAAHQVAAVLARYGKFETVKIKVAEPGQNLQADIDRIKAVIENYPDVKIRLDANGGFDVSTALKLAEYVHEAGINFDYFEQPVKTIAEMAELKLKLSPLGIKIAADESVRKVSDPLAVAQAGAADILVLKVAPLGGINRALQIAAEAGLPVVVSSALDSSVGLSMGAHLAAALPNLEFDCGLATGALLVGDVARIPIKPVDGKISVGRVEVDPAKLDLFEAEDHRIDWWVERLERAYPHIV
ncbi:MAG: hypothetical protein RLZZ258_1082 [Actinomycetota bacterium]